MATAFSLLLSDCGNITNFKTWAQSISTAMSSVFGWTQSSDTGQVNWSTISSVPSVNTYVYEMWQPNDGGTNFYLKIEYGLTGSSSYPNVRFSIGLSTNGAGSLTGSSIGPFSTSGASGTGSTTIPYPCRFSGAPGRFAIMMWDSYTIGWMASVERSVNNTGSYTNSYVTLAVTSWTNAYWGPINQQSLGFTYGAYPQHSQAGNGNYGGMATRYLRPSQNVNVMPIWWNVCGFDLIAPYVGFFDYQMTMMGCTNNYLGGNTITANVYGNPHTYYMSSGAPSFYAGPGNNFRNSTNQAIVMRYD